MTTPTLAPPTTLPAGEIIAAGISADEYMMQYAETFHEWVQGVVIKKPPITERHDLLSAYFRTVLDAYFDLNPVGKVLSQPFVMRLDVIGSFREPDLQIILKDNPGQLTDTAMIGPADICIEIISPESVERDYVQKFSEYEKAGVREYWIIDPIRQRCDFNRRGEAGVYTVIAPDGNGHYRTPLLPRLALHVPTLWQPELPGLFAIAQAVQAMFSDPS
jgi:Uma2 family endonuclease